MSTAKPEVLAAPMPPPRTPRSLLPMVQASLVAGTTFAAIWYELRPIATILLTGLSGLVVLRTTGPLQVTGTLAMINVWLHRNVYALLDGWRLNYPGVCRLAIIVLTVSTVYLGYCCENADMVLALLLGIYIFFVTCCGLDFYREHAIDDARVTEAVRAHLDEAHPDHHQQQSQSQPQTQQPQPQQQSAAAAAVADDSDTDDLLPEESPANALILALATANGSLATGEYDAAHDSTDDTDDSDNVSVADDDDDAHLEAARNNERRHHVRHHHQHQPQQPDAPQMPDIELSDLSSDDDEAADDEAVAAAALQFVAPALRGAIRRQPEAERVQLQQPTEAQVEEEEERLQQPQTGAAGASKADDSLSSSTSSLSDDEDSISRGLDFQSVGLDVADAQPSSAATASSASAAPSSRLAAAEAGSKTASSYTASLTNFVTGLIARNAVQAVAAQVEQQVARTLADSLLTAAPDTSSSSSSEDSDFEFLSHADCRQSPPGSPPKPQQQQQPHRPDAAK